jgi:hypothetical protein
VSSGLQGCHWCIESGRQIGRGTTPIPLCSPRRLDNWRQLTGVPSPLSRSTCKQSGPCAGLAQAAVGGSTYAHSSTAPGASVDFFEMPPWSPESPKPAVAIHYRPGMERLALGPSLKISPPLLVLTHGFGGAWQLTEDMTRRREIQSMRGVAPCRSCRLQVLQIQLYKCKRTSSWRGRGFCSCSPWFDRGFPLPASQTTFNLEAKAASAMSCPPGPWVQTVPVLKSRPSSHHVESNPSGCRHQATSRFPERARRDR